MFKLPDNHPAKSYSFCTPYTEKDIDEIYKLGYKKALEEVLVLTNGEVINGVIKGMIDADLVKAKLTNV